MPGARCARSRAWCVVSTRVSHHGHTGNTRHSPRNGFNGFLRALPGDRAFLPPSPLRSLLLKSLMPASGHQNHTTSPSAPVSEKATRRSWYRPAEALAKADQRRSSFDTAASTASRPAFVTIAKRPFVGRDEFSLLLFLPNDQAKNFSREGWTRKLPGRPSGKSRRGHRGQSTLDLHQ